MIETKKELVVIDDDQAIGQKLASNIKDSDWKLTFFARAEEGLEYLILRTPDALLVDMRMPTMDGYEILEELVAENKALPQRLCVSSAVRPPKSVWRDYEKYGAAFVVKSDLEDYDSFRSLIGSF